MIICNEGKLRILEILRNPSGFQAHPFSNDYYPGPLSVMADFTFQTANTNYGVAWSAPVISNGQGIITAQLLWTNWVTPFTPFTLYGYIVAMGGLAGNVEFAERFDTPIAVTTATQTVTKTLTLVVP